MAAEELLKQVNSSATKKSLIIAFSCTEDCWLSFFTFEAARCVYFSLKNEIKKYELDNICCIFWGRVMRQTFETETLLWTTRSVFLSASIISICGTNIWLCLAVQCYFQMFCWFFKLSTCYLWNGIKFVKNRYIHVIWLVLVKCRRLAGIIYFRAALMQFT